MPEGLKRPEGAGRNKMQFWPQNPTAQFVWKWVQTGQNCSSHACARIKRLVITPRRGVIPPPEGGGKGAGKPKADRATTKRK